MDKAKLIWRERQSDSHFVESVWRCRAPVMMPRAVIADPCMSLSLVKDDQGTRVIFSGPKASPGSIILPTGYTCVTIRLKPGVFVEGLSAQMPAGDSLILSTDEHARFQFAGTVFKFPDFDDAERLIDQFLEKGYLSYETPSNNPDQLSQHLSSRTRSRKVQRLTGLSPYKLYQLQRMHQALRLLKRGMPAVEVASELDFTDQAHLIRASKQFFGHTPKHLAELPQTP